MARNEKKPIIKLPVKITLTSEGVEWFIRNNKQIKRLRMADNRLEYGISLDEFSAASLQKMMNIEYISTVEIARTEFADKRREIIDLNKLIVYRILYRSFDRETYKLFLDSPLIKRWNRGHPTKIIDENSVFNRTQLESLFNSCAPDLPMVSEDIQSGLLKELQADPRLSEEEREILGFLSDRYVISMRNIMWCVLAKSRGEPEYVVLVAKVVSLLRGYLEKSKIAEYLSLMVGAALLCGGGSRNGDRAEAVSRNAIDVGSASQSEAAGSNRCLHAGTAGLPLSDLPGQQQSAFHRHGESAEDRYFQSRA